MSQAPETTEEDPWTYPPLLPVFVTFLCLRPAAVCSNRDGRKNDHPDNDLPFHFTPSLSDHG
jgi:hypothetical protein